ncbi:MAG TPA: glutaredoxin family protein [Candidatus Acidoferrum sp.]|nr:glutaredoxin family protein [Candidatus Acidoferrum sp.]
MNRLAEQILSAFDALGGDSHDLSALSAHASSRAAGKEQLRAEVKHLVAQGMLREDAGRFFRTEDGRLAVAGPRDLTLYSRHGCHLCEEAKKYVTPLAERFGARIREVNIDSDPVLRARYNEEVPVLFLGPRKVAKYTVKLDQLRRQLEEAQ